MIIVLAYFAEALDASEIQIWTDVAGVATTDPRICAEAKSSENSHLKKLLKWRHLAQKYYTQQPWRLPNVQKIPVFVGSSYEPDKDGTWIKPIVDSAPLVRAVTQRKDQALITISNPEC